MSTTVIGNSVLSEEWKVVGATTTKTVLVQSKDSDNSTGCQFNLRLRYGLEGFESPIYSQETSTYLEPNQARLIDFRDLIPGDLQDSNSIGAWQIETQISFNFAPIRVTYYEVDLAVADKAFYQGQLAGKANTGHTHVVADIESLQTSLSAKLNTANNTPATGQVLQAISPTEWEWATVQTGSGGSTLLPNQYVASVNGLTGNVTLALPGLANGTTNGLISPSQFNLLNGVGATNGNVLQIVNNTPTWAAFTVPASVEQWTSLNSNTTLASNQNYVANTGVTGLTTPAAVSGVIRILNNTLNTILLSPSSGVSFSGISQSLEVEIVGTNAVRLLPGKTAKLIGSDGKWIVEGCEVSILSFGYNETPLAPNNSNPLNASDLVHWLGLQEDKDSFTNPSNTSRLVAVASSVFGSGYDAPISVLTNRGNLSNSPSASAFTADVGSQWFAWQLPRGYRFRPTGLLILTRGDADQAHARNFAIRLANGSTLTTSTAVSSWSTAQVFSNQSQITGLSRYFLLPITTTLSGRQLAIQSTGMNSAGALYIGLQEVCWFGDLTFS